MSKHKVSFTHDFTSQQNTVQIEVYGDTPAEIIDTLTTLTEGLAAHVPWKAHTNLAEISKPLRKKDVKRDPSLGEAYARDAALKLLVKVYEDLSLRNEAKALLDKYDIKKFGDIPLDRAEKLLEDAKALVARMENAA